MNRSHAFTGRLLASAAPLALAFMLFQPANAAVPEACQSTSCAFLDKALTPEARARDLVSRMTLEEKAA